MALRGPRFPGILSAVLLTIALACLTACGDDDPVKPPDVSAGLIVVTTPAELAAALENSSAGDTIEIRAEFTSSPLFTMTKGFTIPASRSPVTILGSPKAGFLRPEIAFPPDVTGITLTGHSGSTIKDLDFRGGRDVIAVVNSDVMIEGLVIRDNQEDGITVSGSSSKGTILRCLFENPGVFGVSTSNGSPVRIEKNTVAHAGDCGFYIGSNVSLIGNNIYDAQNFGVFCDGNATSPTLTCNNAFLSANGNYVCSAAIDILKGNYQLDPRFCPENAYYLDFNSPLLEVNSGGCGQIGAFGIAAACQP